MVSTNKARFLFSFGNIGGLLVRKLVKQTKIVSRTPNKSGFDQFWLSEAEAHIGAGGARILRKPDAAVRQELCRLDPADGVIDQPAEFLPLFFVMVVRKYWISTSRFRTKTTWATSEMPVIQRVAD